MQPPAGGSRNLSTAYDWIGSRNFGGNGLVICPVQGCGAVLRQIDGMHSAGDPFVSIDRMGHYVQCPKCGSRIAWPIPRPKPPNPNPAVAA